MKKFILVLMVFAFGTIAVACQKTTAPTSGDTQAPQFKDLTNDNKLRPLTHLKGQEVNLLEGVAAIDDISKAEDLVIVISSKGDYNKDIPGTYVLEYKVTDEAGNSNKANRQVIVKDTVEKAFRALIINDVAIPYIGEGHEAKVNNITYTTDNSFDLMPTAADGAKFRWLDQVFVYSKEKFVTLFDAAVASKNYASNGNIPFSGYGAMAFYDSNMKPIYLRIARGTSIEVFADGTIKSGTEASFQGVSPSASGAGLLQNIKESLAAVENVAYVSLVSTPGLYEACGLFIRSTFYSGYVTGAVTVNNQDVDFTKLNGKIDDDYKLIVEKPANLATPTFTISKNTLFIKGATGVDYYEIYVDGVKSVKTLKCTGAVDLEMRLNGKDNLDLADGTYKIQLKAITKDVLQWSDSELSSEVEYVQTAIDNLTTPVVKINGNNLEWTAITGASKYYVYVMINGIMTTAEKIGETTNTTFDLAIVREKYKNFATLHVVAIGDDTHYNSANSNKAFYDYAEVKALNIDGFQYPVLYTTYADYFARRNENYVPASGSNGYAGVPYIIYVSDFGKFMNNTDANFGKKVTEAFSTVVLLDGDKNPKAISNIFTNFKWTAKDGWYHFGEDVKREGTPNNLVDIIPILSSNDSLLIFKNGNNISVKSEDGTADLTVNARHIGAYHFVANTSSYDVLNTEAAWKTEEESNLVDPTKIVFSFSDTLHTSLPKPVLNYVQDSGIVTWESVQGATSYVLVVGDRKIELASTVNSFDVSSIVDFEWDVIGFEAYLVARADHRNQTSISDKVIQKGQSLEISFKDDVREQVVVLDFKIEDLNAFLLKDITAKHAGKDIAVTIKDQGGFDVKKLGVYVVQYQAVSGNETVTATKTFYVRAAADVSSTKTGVKIGENEFDNNASGNNDYNHTTALKNNGSGAVFRTVDRVMILDSKMYLEQCKEFASTHANNGGVPFGNSGIAIVLNAKKEIVLIRGIVGTALEVNKDGFKTSGLSWGGTAPSAAGAGLLVGLDKEIGTLIPEGGYVCLMGSQTTARVFLISNLLQKGYTGGAFSINDSNRINSIGQVVDFLYK